MPRPLITIQDLAHIKVVGDPQISPDGQCVLYTVMAADVEKNKYWTHLWLSTTRDGTARQFTFGEVSDSSPRWSHDGQKIAFLRNKDEQTQIWVVPADGGEARILTHLPEGNLSGLSWSPDDKALAFAFRRTHTEWTKQAGKRRGENGKSKPPRVVTRSRYRLDGSGFQDERQHIWTCEAATGRASQVTHGNYDDDMPAWSPDSRTLVFVSNRSADPDRLLYEDDLWLVPARGGKLRKLRTPTGSKTAPAWSPDGKWIAYIGAEAGEDPWRPKNDRLWVVTRQGGNAHCLSLELDRTVGNATLGDVRAVSPAVVVWSPDGRTLYVTMSDSGSVHLCAVDLASCHITRLTRGAVDVAGFSLDAAGKRLALLIADPTHPAEVFIATPKGQKTHVTRLTDQNGAWLGGIQVSQPQEFWITQPDGARVQGWTLCPPNMKKSQKYPLLLYVHGGPHAQYGNVFFHELQWHAARGYVVVYGNPRGSNGREEEFGACIHRDWGNLDYQDVLALADHAELLPFVDSNRKAIAGGSYGGYMTNWVVGHTNRFQCAITDRCVSNFISMVGTSDMPPPPNSYWPGNPWGDDMEKGWNMSPIKYVANVRTPMMIIHSEGDLRCPIEQAEQWFTALVWLKLKPVLVRYPPETSHGLSRGGPLDLRFDRLRRIGDWLDRHLEK